MTEEKSRSVTLYSYRKVWVVEKKIYKFQNVVLPFPINPYELLEFLAVVGIVLVLTRIFPILQGIPPVLRYGAFPYVVVKYLMKLKLDGKNPFRYFVGLLGYLAGRGRYLEHFRSCTRENGKVKLNWNCSKA